MNIFDCFADKVRLTVKGADFGLLASVVTIGQDSDGKVCALAFDIDAEEPVRESAAAAAAHLGLKPQVVPMIDPDAKLSAGTPQYADH